MDYRSIKKILAGLLALALLAPAAVAYDVPTLGASATATNPRRASEAGTGIYSDATQVVGIAAGGRTAAKFLFATGGSNWLTFTPSNSGDPLISVDGGSTNPGLILSSKGTGAITFMGGTGTVTAAKIIEGSTSAVNYLQLSGAATSSVPTLTAFGSDTDVSLGLTSQAAGSINLNTGGGRQVRIFHVASAVNYVKLAGAATTASPTISTDGSDTDIDLTLNAKGAGKITTGTFYVLTAGQNVVSTQLDRASSTTLTSVTGLSAPMKNGKTYTFRAVLNVTADATGGHKYAVTSTGTVSAIIYEIHTTCNTSGLLIITSRQTSLGGSAGQAGCTDPYTEISGTATASSDGTLQIQFGENAASGTSSVLVGSYINVNRVN